MTPELIELFETTYLMGRVKRLSWEDCVTGYLDKHRKPGNCLHRRENGEYVSPATREAWEWFSLGANGHAIELPIASEYATENCGLKEIIAFNFAVSVIEERLLKAGIKIKAQGAS